MQIIRSFKAGREGIEKELEAEAAVRLKWRFRFAEVSRACSGEKDNGHYTLLKGSIQGLV